MQITYCNSAYTEELIVGPPSPQHPILINNKTVEIVESC